MCKVAVSSRTGQGGGAGLGRMESKQVKQVS